MNSGANLNAILVIRIPVWVKEKLEKMAMEKGVGVSTLARMILMEEANRHLKSSKSS